MQPTLFAGLTDSEKKICEALKSEGDLTIDSLARMLEIPVHKLSTTLLQMELAGMITPFPGNVYRISN